MLLNLNIFRAFTHKKKINNETTKHDNKHPGINYLQITLAYRNIMIKHNRFIVSLLVNTGRNG